MRNSVLTAAIVATCLKVSLIPSYHSTDFEVHRNWLAITHSLPLSRWYHHNTSQWTLDYPPLFAYFELFLSYPAALLDPEITRLDNLDYDSDTCVTFQRLSVVASDLVLILATGLYVDALVPQKATALSVLLVCCPCLVLVDHIHFQYNGMLLGILLLSLVAMKREWYVTAAAIFTLLLFFKHIFIYLSPAYFVFLLAGYCLHTTHSRHSFLKVATTRFVALGLTVLSISFLSLLPFISHLDQLVSRLFPFKRGLTHAYWAPNIWAIYNAADLTLSRLLLSYPDTSSTRGLVGHVSHLFLPSPTPLSTLACTILAMIPAMLIGMRSKGSSHFDRFLTSLTLCGLAAFMCGWHVHEKAILLVTFPLALLAVEHADAAPIYTLLSTAGLFSLFPLVNQLREAPIKLCLIILNFNTCQFFLPRCANTSRNLSRFELVYLAGFVPLAALDVLGSGPVGLKGYTFLPLLLTSLYCALGNVYVWMKMLKFAINLA